MLQPRCRQDDAALLASPAWLVAAFCPTGPRRAPLRGEARWHLFPALPDAQHPNGKRVTATNREGAHEMEVPEPTSPRAATNSNVTQHPAQSRPRGPARSPAPAASAVPAPEATHLAKSAENDLAKEAERLPRRGLAPSTSSPGAKSSQGQAAGAPGRRQEHRTHPIGHLKASVSLAHPKFVWSPL